MIGDRPRRRFGLAGPLMLGIAFIGWGAIGPASADAPGAASTIAQYFDALRHMDRSAVRATLAPDYSYDRSNQPAFDPENPFDSPLALIYHSLFYRLVALTTAGKTATATLMTVSDGELNPPLIGRTPVIGQSSLGLELEQRAGVWKITAVRPVRVTYRNPQVPLPPEAEISLSLGLTTLDNYSVNGQISLKTPPGAPLKLTGTSHRAAAVLGVIGAFNPLTLQTAALHGNENEPWTLQLQAPDTPGRYLAYALSIAALPDPANGGLRFVAGDQVTLPVTVVRSP